MKKLAFTVLLSCLVLGAFACGADAVPIAPDSNATKTYDGALIYEAPSLILIVADDADTPEAAQLRAKLAQSLGPGLKSLIQHRLGFCGNPDPAAWHTGDVRVAIVRPSAPDDLSLLSPIEMPELSWITQSSKPEEVDTLVANTSQALSQRLAKAGESYQPLHATKRALDLIAGARPPENASETQFKNSLSKDLMVQVVFATTRDDEGSEALSTLKPSQSANFLRPLLMGPYMADPINCYVNTPGNSRLESWASDLSFEIFSTPCGVQSVWDNIFAWGGADCGPACEDRRIQVSAQGVAACRFYIDQADLNGCDAGHGWKDPDGKATMVDHAGESFRRCEIAQLEGAALSSCRQSLACEGCGSGFCVTEVPELLYKDLCPAGSAYWGIRFVGGSISAGRGYFHGVCGVE